MCRPRAQENQESIIVDHYDSDQYEWVPAAAVIQHEIDLELLTRSVANLKRHLTRLYAQERQLMQVLQSLRSTVRSSSFFQPSRWTFLFFVSGFFTGFYVIPLVHRHFFKNLRF